MIIIILSDTEYMLMIIEICESQERYEMTMNNTETSYFRVELGWRFLWRHEYVTEELILLPPEGQLGTVICMGFPSSWVSWYYSIFG